MRWIYSIGVASLLISAACGATRPVIDTGAKPPTVDGTIAGHVLTAAGDAPVVGRRVTATDVATGRTYQTSTGAAGSYTLKVPPGKYRLAVELKAGESIAKGAGDTDVNASDVDAQRDFTLTAP